MSGTAHVYPNAVQQLVTKSENLNNSDVLKVGLIDQSSVAYTWNGTSQGHKFISDFLGGSGAGALTEVSTSGTGYARTTLTGVSCTTTGLVTTLTCSTVSLTASSNWGAKYAFFYDSSIGAGVDSATPLICYWDFGGTVSVVNGGNFTLTINASGLVTFTAS
jgi:hypothetical protein